MLKKTNTKLVQTRVPAAVKRSIAATAKSDGLTVAAWLRHLLIKKFESSKTEPDSSGFSYIPTGVTEVDNVLGGGLVYGNIVLVAADPGVGKSRLCLSVAKSFANGGRRALYACGEDTKLRAQQLAFSMEIKNQDVLVLGDPSGLRFEDVVEDAIRQNVNLVVLDSIKSCNEGKPLTEKATKKLRATIQGKNLAVLAIGHVLKDGQVSGGATLKHAVDVILRLTRHEIYDNNGDLVPGSENLCLLSVDGKSHQSSVNLRSFLEMSETGLFRTPSLQLQKELVKFEVPMSI